MTSKVKEVDKNGKNFKRPPRKDLKKVRTSWKDVRRLETFET